MVQQRLIVNLVVDVEAVPQIAADHHATEAQLLHLLHVVDVHTTQGKHLLIDQSLFRRCLQFLTCERRFLVLIRLTVIDGVQEHVVRLLFASFSSLMA